jgi:hypothetical protein
MIPPEADSIVLAVNTVGPGQIWSRQLHLLLSLSRGERNRGRDVPCNDCWIGDGSFNFFLFDASVRVVLWYRCHAHLTRRAGGVSRATTPDASSKAGVTATPDPGPREDVSNVGELDRARCGRPLWGRGEGCFMVSQDTNGSC